MCYGFSTNCKRALLGVAAGGALARVEVGSGFSHSRQSSMSSNEVSQGNTFLHATGNMLSAVESYANKQAEEAKVEVEKAKAERDAAIAKGEIAQIAEKESAYRQAKATQESWETGGSQKRKLDTVVTVLGTLLAGKPAAETAVAALSPTLNAQIKQHTQNADGTTDTATNLLAHALLGAVEAQVTGNNALAGAAAGAGGEVAAMYLTKALYNKDANQLTEDEKKNIVLLSQVASGLAAGVTGDSTQSAVIGADIGKRAVENNYLSQFSQNRRDWLRKQLERKDLSSKKREQYEQEYIKLEQDDHTSDYLVTKVLHNPEQMTKSDWALYIDYAKRYYLESTTSHHKPEEVQKNLNNILSNNYIRDYDYSYALAEKYRSNLPSRWGLFGVNKSENEQFYSDIAGKYQNRATYENSFNGRVAKSTAEALGYVSSSSNVLSSIPKIGELAKKYPTLSEMAIIGTANTVAQLSSKDPYLYSSFIETELSYLLTRKDSASVAWSKNMMLGSYMEQAEKQEKAMRFGIKEEPEYFKKGLGVTFGALVNKGSDRIYSRFQSPYIHNLVKPTINAIVGEGTPKTLDAVEDSMNKAMESK